MPGVQVEHRQLERSQWVESRIVEGTEATGWRALVRDWGKLIWVMVDYPVLASLKVYFDILEEMGDSFLVKKIFKCVKKGEII